jgi:DNA/RNA endonuclease YhcR with UshA esterase domain
MSEPTQLQRASRAILVVVTLTALASAKEKPTSISASEAASYVGQTKTVCGAVASSKFASSTKGSPTFLNLDRPYPNQVFTALIWGTDRAKFKEPPEVTFQGKRICVTGSIQLYNDKPEIIVNDPSQIH